MKWQPWIDYKKDAEVLDIEDPPCKACKHFRPIRTYGRNGVFDSVKLCHVRDSGGGGAEMEADFSCYESHQPIGKKTND